MFSLLVYESPLYSSHCSIVLSHFSPVWLFVTPWTVACQAFLSLGFSRQEYRSRLPFLPPGDFLDPGIKRMSPMSPAFSGGLPWWLRR